MVNPLSLQLRLSLGWKHGLSDSDNVLLKGSHIAAGVSEAISPAYSRTGGWVRITPLSILEITAGAELAGFFGTFSNISSFPSYDADFSDDARDGVKGEATTGYRLHVSPVLQFAFGRVALRSSWSIDQWKLNAAGPYCYEPFRGTLIKKDGDVVVAGSTLMLVDLSRARDRSFQVGILHDLVHVPDAPQNRMQRIGPFMAKSLGAKRFGLTAPVLYLGVLPYLEAPNRSGVAGLLAIGFSGF
jgi:hypothetical protein